ncbi:MAG: DNA gyrase subunit A, partial [Prevotella sp.]|nr:DNA gyrase subunit A [Prevotella sp.]
MEQTQDNDRILKVNIAEEMKSSYIDYSMSVIVARALPDVRDGFKPVHRRILYGMLGIGNTSDSPYKKCARVVGEVLGKYHPHGDSSVYGALVRMGQDWNMRYTLVDGQGNFGSIDGDSPAAMRYTECRLSKMGEHIMDDIKKDTVDMVYNFDDTLLEPTVMPTKIPNLLVNGGNGIAVGMATNMPTHNLNEVIDGCCAYIDNPDIDTDGLMQYIKGPDFPTGAYIYGLQGVKNAYETGRGRIIMRAKAEIESDDQHDKIVVTEIPYGVNKAQLIENIADLVKEGKLDGISNANDESGRQGMRIVVDVKRDANANVILNKLFKLTALQSSFSVNNIALVNGRPKLLTLKECVHYFVEHRRDVTIRRTKYDLKKAEERAHILEGLLIAVNNIDEVVRIIRASKSPSDAQRALEERFNIDEIQSKAIVEMRLGQLTGLRVDELKAEYAELERLIEYYNNILTDPELCKKVMKDELQEVKERYGDERRTEIKYTSEEFNPEDFYPNDPIVVTISNLGYIKRMNQTEFKQQHRGGLGVRAASTRETDFTKYIYPAMTHDWMLFFTAKGRVFWAKSYDIPEGNRQAKGRALQNFLNIDSDDSVRALLTVESLKDKEYLDNHYVIFVTRNAVVKRVS